MRLRAGLLQDCGSAYHGGGGGGGDWEVCVGCFFTKLAADLSRGLGPMCLPQDSECEIGQRPVSLGGWL